MPGTQFVDPLTMTFTLRRPANIVENPDGEAGLLEVILADGVPSNGLSFIIDTLRILVLGDSVAWGQGLPAHEKYSTLVEAALAATSGGIKSYSTILAHSGATIGIGDVTVMPALPGEVPTSYPTVLQQLDNYGGASDSVDLVLVTAGLNDVNIRTVLNPLNKAADFAPAIEQHCHQDLRTLLVATASRFPLATVVATSYYPILSEDSDTTLISAFLVAAGLTVAGLPGGILSGQLLAQVLVNCRAFHELSTFAIAAAVDDANDEFGATRVLFADPGFGGDNAALASSPWVFGINPDLSPQDNIVATQRAPACEANLDRTDVFVCRRASMGHPNSDGAQAYAAAIMQALDRGVVDEEAALPRLPQGFLLGVATSAMQNEGYIDSSDWAAFVNSPAIRARVRTLTAGEPHPVNLTDMADAIRHADLSVLTADLDLAWALGANSYRFSIEWARLQPTPPNHGGALSDADLDMAAVAYYDQVLDTLQARSLTPVVTLNHFSLPQWVLNPPRGQIALGTDPVFAASLRGWENPATVDAFVELVAYVVARWMGRVHWWITLNEPVGSMVVLGYVVGIWPPGFTGDGESARTAYFNLIRAHIRCYQAIKALSADAMVGLAHAMLDSKVTTAAVDNLLGDQEAARNQFDYFYNWHLLEAIIAGRLDTNVNRRPQQQTLLVGQALADWLGVNVATIEPWKRHCDFVGLNFYRSVYVYVDAAVSVAAPFTGGRITNDLEGSDQVHQLLNDLGWEISPGGFGRLLRELRDRYEIPVLITENGVPQAVDRHRAAFITAHLHQLLRAVADGVDVRGYLYWTLADNWELQEGYRPEASFGLFTVDRSNPAQPRWPTHGAHAFAYIASRGDLRGARDRFGTITPGGDRVVPPRYSPILLAGVLDGNPMAMCLWRDPDGHLRGLLNETVNDRWLPLQGQVDIISGTFTLSHPAMMGVAAGTFIGQRTGATGALSVTGVLSRAGVDFVWSATKDPLIGEWTGPRPLPRVRIVHPREDLNSWTGMWLTDALPRSWRPLVVTVAGVNVVFDTGGGPRFDGTITGNGLVGQVTWSGVALPWSGKRLDDGFLL
jgi:beta-glucosidase/6-phospho-beta-glucosidase/beta-galactosidase/lysophospholipase L1-like esterase